MDIYPCQTKLSIKGPYQFLHYHLSVRSTRSNVLLRRCLSVDWIWIHEEKEKKEAYLINYESEKNHVTKTMLVKEPRDKSVVLTMPERKIRFLSNKNIFHSDLKQHSSLGVVINHNWFENSGCMERNVTPSKFWSLSM